MISEKIVNTVKTMELQAEENRLSQCSFRRGCQRLIALADEVWRMEQSAGLAVPLDPSGENVVAVDFQGKRNASR